MRPLEFAILVRRVGGRDKERGRKKNKIMPGFGVAFDDQRYEAGRDPLGDLDVLRTPLAAASLNGFLARPIYVVRPECANLSSILLVTLGTRDVYAPFVPTWAKPCCFPVLLQCPASASCQ